MTYTPLKYCASATGREIHIYDSENIDNNGFIGSTLCGNYLDETDENDNQLLEYLTYDDLQFCTSSNCNNCETDDEGCKCFYFSPLINAPASKRLVGLAKKRMILASYLLGKDVCGNCMAALYKTK